MKNMSKKIVALLIALCAVLCAGCGSFDTSGYVKAVLDNSIKGDSAALAEFTKSSEDEVKALYDQQIDENLNSLLSGVTVDETLQADYRTLVVDMLNKTKYEVGESTKNSDGSYTVTVTINALQIEATDAIAEKTTAYVTELQESVANGGEIPSDDEIMEETYRITLECLQEALANATYGEAVEKTVTVSIENKLYTPNQSDLDNISMSLIELN